MEIVGVIIGALIALAGTIVVQLWLVPLVESRNRREQRWEADVRSLGELLTFTEPKAISDAVSELHWRILLAEPPEDADPDRLAALRREREEPWRSAWDAYDQVSVKARWLVDRVKSLAPQSKVLTSFDVRSRKRLLAHWRLDAMRYAVGDKPPTREALHDAHDEVRNATRDLVEELKRLADGRPPRNPPPTTRWVSARWARLRGKERNRSQKKDRPPT